MTRARVMIALVMVLLATAVLVPEGARGDAFELVGRPAPALRARALDADDEIDLSRYRGRVVLLAFVASWCGSCRRFAPTLDAIARVHADDELSVVAVSHEARERLRAHVSATPRAYPTLQCTPRTALAYGADALPTLVLVDREGRVQRALQRASIDAASLRRDIAALLARGAP
ncbi:MAG: TlpA family protein disulfide reductase [Sandaracinaceae bacterium]